MENLKEILEKHHKWLKNEKDGERADLSSANLRGANLREANLSWANLSSADLRRANLRRADLSEANLRWADLSLADLRRADLSEANLSSADLSLADLRGADLSLANLSLADLSLANLRGADLPSPTILLLCNWGEVSSKLTTELMRYDAANCLKPSKFDDWAKGGNCPLERFDRSAHFREKRELWEKGNPKTAIELILLLFEEKEIKF